MIRKAIILNGERLGTNFCAACARRHVLGILHKRGHRELKTSDLKAAQTTTASEIRFTLTLPK